MSIARHKLSGVLNGALRYAGIEVRSVRKEPQSPGFTDVEPWVADIIKSVRPFTMTSDERISALCHATRYISHRKIPGDVVECGVWRGGSIMAAALTLLAAEDISRQLFLFDTFEGMPPPSDLDRATVSQIPAAALLKEADKSSDIWAYSPLEEVRANVMSTGYPPSLVHFIKGRVEDTLPEDAPKQIALLRLDTDWYESTKHELIHLYPRISSGGVLIIDDYGFWDGARRAVDEYITEQNATILLNRIDSTGRIAVKPH